ncbi:MAG TPA: hypothetical protein VF658_21645 [Pyrinomonadaceae bacterium]|jgi:hypothetical protein
MSRSLIAASLIAGICFLSGGIALGRHFGLSLFNAVGLGLLPALLLAYPLMKWWYHNRLSFTSWVLAVATIAIAATLINMLVT